MWLQWVGMGLFIYVFATVCYPSQVVSITEVEHLQELGMLTRLNLKRNPVQVACHETIKEPQLPKHECGLDVTL